MFFFPYNYEKISSGKCGDDTINVIATHNEQNQVISDFGKPDDIFTNKDSTKSIMMYKYNGDVFLIINKED